VYVNSYKKINDRSNNAYNDSINRIIEKSVNILSFFTNSIYPPTYTNELKDVGRFLGFTWSDENASGIQSILWRKKWELSKDIYFFPFEELPIESLKELAVALIHDANKNYLLQRFPEYGGIIFDSKTPEEYKVFEGLLIKKACDRYQEGGDILFNTLILSAPDIEIASQCGDSYQKNFYSFSLSLVGIITKFLPKRKRKLFQLKSHWWNNIEFYRFVESDIIRESFWD